MPQGKFQHASASHDAPNFYGIGQYLDSSFLVFATMKASCSPHPARLFLRLLCCSCRNAVEWTSIILSCMNNCRGRGRRHISLIHRLCSGHQSASYEKSTLPSLQGGLCFCVCICAVVDNILRKYRLGNTKKSQPGQCGGLVSTFTAAFSQRSSLWLLQRSPTCYIWSTWTVRLLQQSRLILWCPLRLFPLALLLSIGSWHAMWLLKEREVCRVRLIWIA